VIFKSILPLHRAHERRKLSKVSVKTADSMYYKTCYNHVRSTIFHLFMHIITTTFSKIGSLYRKTVFRYFFHLCLCGWYFELLIESQGTFLYRIPSSFSQLFSRVSLLSSRGFCFVTKFLQNAYQSIELIPPIIYRSFPNITPGVLFGKVFGL